jgi:hypothetical protein
VSSRKNGIDFCAHLVKIVKKYMNSGQGEMPMQSRELVEIIE